MEANKICRGSISKGRKRKMNIIQDYLDSLFLNVPMTPETKKAKQDLLATMEDHYLALIAEGKSEHEAIGAVISEFGSIDELLAELEIETNESHEDSFIDAIELDEAEQFWDVVRKFAFQLAIGIFFCIASTSIVIFFAERDNEIIGVLGMFVAISIGVGFLIFSGLNYSSAKKKLNDRPISREVQKQAKRNLEGYERSFQLGLVLGIGACILALTPLLMIEAIFYLPSYFAVSLFMGMVALGVFLIVYVSLVRNGFVKFTKSEFFLSDEDEPGPRATAHKYGSSKKGIQLVKKYYWSVVIVVYFLWSFSNHSWAYSWILFMVAGIFEDILLDLLHSFKD